MKVDNPKFDSYSPPGTVKCVECPFADESGNLERNILAQELCGGWGTFHSVCCPTKETYLEACLLSDSTENKAEEECPQDDLVTGIKKGA